MRHALRLLAALTLIAISGPRARADLFGDVDQECRDQQRYQRDLDRFQGDFARGDLAGEVRDLQRLRHERYDLQYDQWQLRQDLDGGFAPVPAAPPPTAMPGTPW